MKYCEAFCMRRHTEDTEKLQTNDAASWTLVCSTTVHKPMWLQSFVVGEVKNPFPAPRLDLLKVNGANGELDMSEIDGSLAYERKEITVILSHKPTVYEPALLNAVNTKLREWHGALVDVAFSTPSSVQYYYIGRIVASQYDYDKERVTFTINAQPFAYKANVTNLHPARSARVTANLELTQADAGIFDVSLSGHVLKIWGSVGSQAKLRVAATMPEGAFVFGTKNAKGGTWYISRDELTYQALKNMSPKVIGSTDGNGNFYIAFTIDGSYYEWYSDNGTMKYVPCLSLTWELLSVSLDSDDENIVLLEQNSSVRVEALNVGGSAIAVVDGEIAVVNTSEPSLIAGYKVTDIDGVWVPSRKSKSKTIEGHGVWSVFAYTNNGTVSTNADVTFSFREEVLHE